MVLGKRSAGILAVLLAVCTLFALAACTGRPTASASGASDSTAIVEATPSTEQGSASSPQAPAPAARAKPSIMFQGQASVRIVTPEGKVIYVDPYAGEDSWYDLPADLILVTHAHFDHNGLNRVANRSEGCVIITQDDAVDDDVHPVFDFDFATVLPVQAGFNSLHNVYECVGYVIELNDGSKVYLTGDTSTTDDMRDGTLAAMRIDYAFWCTDDVYNMGNDEASDAARMVDAAHDIPYHNDTTNSGMMFDREAADAFASPNALVLNPGEEISL